MDTEKSNSSSFEDLSMSNDLKESTENVPATSTDNKQEKTQDDVMDIIGTGQLTKKVSFFEFKSQHFSLVRYGSMPSLFSVT